ARMLVKNPGFTLVAALTLALGIGANSAIFSVVNGVLFKSLPYPDDDRLVVVTEETQAAPGLPVAYPDYLDWKVRQPGFENLAAHMVVGGILPEEASRSASSGAESQPISSRRSELYRNWDALLRRRRTGPAAIAS